MSDRQKPTAQPLHFHRKRNYQSIRKDKVVQLKCLVSDAQTGETLSYRDDMVYLHGGYGSAFPKLEAALEGLQVDMTAEATVEPQDAYGEADPALLMKVPADAIPEAARQVGIEIEGEAADGSSRNFRVVAIDEQGITVDGNHPFAGRRLRFKVEVRDIRDATAEELAAGYGFRKAPRP
jgi:FKBP-type peptidyl-prolyl cis-trans isomerase SlyD